MSDDGHPGEDPVAEFDRRGGYINKVLQGRREGLGEAHREGGLEAILDKLEENGVENPSVENIRVEHFRDENFRETYKEGVSEKLAEQAVQYVNATDQSLESFEGQELLNLYTNESKRAIEQTIDSYLAQLGSVEEFTSGNFESYLKENLENFDDTKIRAQQWQQDHLDRDDVGAIIDYAGIGDLYREEVTPPGLAARLGQQKYNGQDVSEQDAVNTALQAEQPSVINPDAVSDDDVRNQLLGMGSANEITDLYK
jgi:hypothetical protein